MKIKYWLIILIGFLNLFGIKKQDNEIIVKLISAKGQSATGTIKFVQHKNILTISGDIFELTPGLHGMHIHENGACGNSNDFMEAGNHFNPSHIMHGSMNSGHLGDLGNIVADKKGHASFSIQTEKINIKNDHNQSSILNRTIIIHLQKDDMKNDPSGNSGARILCGEIH